MCQPPARYSLARWLTSRLVSASGPSSHTRISYRCGEISCASSAVRQRSSIHGRRYVGTTTEISGGTPAARRIAGIGEKWRSGGEASVSITGQLVHWACLVRRKERITGASSGEAQSESTESNGADA